MSQVIKYESTTIDAVKTASEITALIVRYGGSRTSIDWDEGHPVSISFTIFDKSAGVDIPIQLRARSDSVFKYLSKKRPHRRGNRQEHDRKLRELSQRIVWRHLKDLIEQQLLAVEIGAFDLAEIFLHGVVIRTDAGFSTLGELATLNGPASLVAGS